jgi:hypothetical protein
MKAGVPAWWIGPWGKMLPVTGTTLTGAESPTGKLDQTCAAAIDLARDAILDEHVGAHLGVMAEGERVVTHSFECTLPGYRGWRWAVTVARAPRSKHVTICETVLLPGEEALLAPSWVPWHERLQPGDLGVGDLLPTRADDERLAHGYVLSDDPAVEEVSWELGLGRSRVMSREGRAEAAQRWYDSDHGPEAPISVGAPANARCGLCAFYLPLAGSLRQIFGVCGNLFAPDDGRVVSADHGCGAHSEVLIEAATPVEELPTIYDDADLDIEDLSSSAEAGAEYEDGEGAEGEDAEGEDAEGEDAENGTGAETDEPDASASDGAEPDEAEPDEAEPDEVAPDEAPSDEVAGQDAVTPAADAIREAAADLDGTADPDAIDF